MPLPVILQTQAGECGLACLAMVASHLGLRTDLATLGGRFSISMNGTSLGALSDYADRLKPSTRGVRLELEELRDLKPPRRWPAASSQRLPNRPIWMPPPRRCAGGSRATHR